MPSTAKHQHDLSNWKKGIVTRAAVISFLPNVVWISDLGSTSIKRWIRWIKIPDDPTVKGHLISRAQTFAFSPNWISDFEFRSQLDFFSPPPAWSSSCLRELFTGGNHSGRVYLLQFSAARAWVSGLSRREPHKKWLPACAFLHCLAVRATQLCTALPY